MVDCGDPAPEGSDGGTGSTAPGQDRGDEKDDGWTLAPGAAPDLQFRPVLWSGAGPAGAPVVPGAGEDLLPSPDGGSLLLAPAAVSGPVFTSARAVRSFDGTWVVTPRFRPGADGIDSFNAIAAECYSGGARCPAVDGGKGRLALVLDGTVLMAPSINAPRFAPDQIQVGAEWNQARAEEIARKLVGR